MDTSRELRFQLSERIGDTEVSPTAVPLGLLKQFSEEVARFLSGSRREIDAAALPVAVEAGSFMLRVPRIDDDTLTLWGDLEALQAEDSLHLIDPRRRDVMLSWQQQARSKPGRTYVIGGPSRPLKVTERSDFRLGETSSWVKAERYLTGKVVDMGGKTAANLHLQLPGGQSLKIEAGFEQLANEKDNHLYHEVLLRVALEENMRTGELRNARLLGFEPYRPRFDSDAFEAFVSKGTNAWRDVDDPVAWVREQRGS